MVLSAFMHSVNILIHLVSCSYRNHLGRLNRRLFRNILLPYALSIIIQKAQAVAPSAMVQVAGFYKIGFSFAVILSYTESVVIQ